MKACMSFCTHLRRISPDIYSTEIFSKHLLA